MMMVTRVWRMGGIKEGEDDMAEVEIVRPTERGCQPLQPQRDNDDLPPQLLLNQRMREVPRMMEAVVPNVATFFTK